MSNTHLELQHLLKDILSLMQVQFVEGISEFEIISMLKNPPFLVFDEDALRDSLVLFQTHFIVFHTLYNLRKEWRVKQIGELEISATLIKLNPVCLSTDYPSIADPLADYYLNWQNLTATDQAGVDELLTNFWQKMAVAKVFQKLSETDLNDAFAVLKLDSSEYLSLAMLKQQYRKLQHSCHPDKGGSVEQSQLILEAYTNLYRHLSA
ncbi:MAG: hypothetical protein ACI97K_000210 [Glaciecola sp.]|jgi:hypothetical protein